MNWPHLLYKPFDMGVRCVKGKVALTSIFTILVFLDTPLHQTSKVHFSHHCKKWTAANVRSKKSTAVIPLILNQGEKVYLQPIVLKKFFLQASNR